VWLCVRVESWHVSLWWRVLYSLRAPREFRAMPFHCREAASNSLTGTAIHTLPAPHIPAKQLTWVFAPLA
jgi:hypothetical protein